MTDFTLSCKFMTDTELVFGCFLVTYPRTILPQLSGLKWWRSGKRLFISGIYHRNRPIRAREKEGRDVAVSGPIRKSPLCDWRNFKTAERKNGKYSPFMEPTGGYGWLALDVVSSMRLWVGEDKQEDHHTTKANNQSVKLVHAASYFLQINFDNRSVQRHWHYTSAFTVTDWRLGLDTCTQLLRQSSTSWFKEGVSTAYIN